ncbi:hypothetical protein Hsar01_01373 [Haloferula sargassicola]|uniref:Uncharacterized protein n=1 Tax=Haloferula sargassicola TaxID=490096 RepID=A0ABP9UKM5_9BACT
MFSATFLQILVYVGLTWTGLGALALVILLIRDWKRGELW